MKHEQQDSIRDIMIGVMIGIISSIDLMNQRDIISLTSDPLVSDLYMKSVDDHCAMNIYLNDEVH